MKETDLKSRDREKEDHSHSQQIKLNNITVSLWDKRKVVLYPYLIAMETLAKGNIFFLIVAITTLSFPLFFPIFYQTIHRCMEHRNIVTIYLKQSVHCAFSPEVETCVKVVHYITIHYHAGTPRAIYIALQESLDLMKPDLPYVPVCCLVDLSHLES